MGWAPIMLPPLNTDSDGRLYVPDRDLRGEGPELYRASIPTSPVRLSIRLLRCHACLVPDCSAVCQTVMRYSVCTCACLPDDVTACNVATALVSV